MRKHWIDNLRWATVLLVLLYHVIYFYNNKGVFGGIGGFGEYPDVPQYQDVVMYILYPFFMPLLFILVQGAYAETAGAGDYRPFCFPLDGGILQHGGGAEAGCL